MILIRLDFVLFQLVTRAVDELEHDVPNMRLHEMKTVADVVKYFQTEVKDTSVFEDMSKLNLPRNLHMNLEFNRFDPETDKVHDGVTAFPGSKTIVSSLRYRKKYKNLDGGDVTNDTSSIITTT